MKRILPIFLAAGLLLGATGCTREDIARDAIVQYFPVWAEQKATAVAHCESRLNPGAISPGGGNWGLFQINRATWEPTVNRMGYRWDEVLNPYINAKIALYIWHDVHNNSWSAWGCRNA